MQHPTPHSNAVTGPSKSALILAIAAPFAVIALLATPLAFDALKHAIGS